MRTGGCGYEPCPCWGIHFISGYKDESDYCIDGKRVTLRDDGLIWRATKSEALRLQSFLLEDYADYLRGRGRYNWRQHLSAPVCPFGYPLPLRWAADLDGLNAGGHLV